MSVNVKITQGLPDQDFVLDQFEALKATPKKLEPLPEELQLWLGRLRLLYGVPFEYIVPDERLLPKESIRFFYLDRNWLDRLVDGALSIGKVVSRDFLHHEQKIESLRQAMSVSEVTTRKMLRGNKNINLESLEVGGTMTGMLVRSTIVEDYPGLEVRAYSKSCENDKGLEIDKLPLLRMDRLAPDMLLCIFQGVPKHLEIEEPREGIQCGVEEDSQGRNYIVLRSADGSYVGAGKGEAPDEATPEVDVPFCEGDKRVIDVSALCAAIGENDEVSGNGQASSSDLSLQLLQFPYLQMFDGEGKCDGDGDVGPWQFAEPFQQPMTFYLLGNDGTEKRDVPERTKKEIEEKVKVALPGTSLGSIFG